MAASSSRGEVAESIHRRRLDRRTGITPPAPAPMGDHAPVDRSESRVLTKRTLQASSPTSKERDMSQTRREQMPIARSTGVSRRHLLAGTAAALATASTPIVWPRRASAAGKVVLRTIGGAYEEAVVKAIIEPFTKATGVEVVKAPATLGKLLAMFESGNIELDVVDAGELGMISLSQKGALEKINYKGWKLSNPDDMDPIVRRDDMVGDIYFSSVLGYNTQSFP